MANIDNGTGAVGVRDFLLGSDGDLVINNGDFVLVSGAPAAQQGVSFRLGFVQGDWFLDREDGIPYFTRILIKHPNYAEAREWVRLAIIDTPDIVSVDSIDLAFNPSTRGLVIYYGASTATGAIRNQKGIS